MKKDAQKNNNNSKKKKMIKKKKKKQRAGTTRSPEMAACKVKCHGAYVTSALMSRVLPLTLLSE